MEDPCLLDNHVLEFLGGLEGTDAPSPPTCGGSVPDPQSPIDAVENAVMINPRLASRE